MFFTGSWNEQVKQCCRTDPNINAEVITVITELQNSVNLHNESVRLLRTVLERQLVIPKRSLELTKYQTVNLKDDMARQ